MTTLQIIGLAAPEAEDVVAGWTAFGLFGLGALAVVALGFPANGNGLAVTRGVISRIDYAAYNDRTEGLRIQVDTPAMPGNSGGPALVDGKMIGLIFGRA